MWLNISGKQAVWFLQTEIMFFKCKNDFQNGSLTVNTVHTHVWFLKKNASYLRIKFILPLGEIEASLAYQ